VTFAHEPVYSATLEGIRIARRANALVSYDVNFRPALYPDREQGRHIIMRPLHEVDILKMNEGELKLITGAPDVESGLRQIETSAPLVAITMAEKGCLYRFAGKLHHEQAAPAEAVDATGAGDAFMAALLSGYRLPLDEEYLAKLIRRACQAGAIAVTKRGAIPSLPYAHQLDPL
jgi:sugar/nucleoside kinase (ribokinase family)